jgi:hypothetical protein
MLTAAGARADSIPITINVTPVWFLNTGSDATAYPPPGTVPINAPTIPRTTDNVRLNYGISLKLGKRGSLAYSHANFDFSLGRILTVAPGTSLLTGDIDDRIDTISYNYGFGHGLNGSVYYFSHQRSYVAGLCLNQIDCPNAAGVSVSNPSTINSNGYGIGFKYAAGPVSKYTGPLLTFNADAQYIPRPVGNCGTPTALPGCNTDGINGYKSSQVIFPYGVTMNIPIRNDLGVIPLIDYKREIVLWRAENSAEMYNVVEYGFVKIIRPDLTFAMVESNWKGCVCSDTVPPPDNVRFSDLIASLTYSFKP